MLSIRERNAEPIKGYRLLDPLGRGGFGEVWKCEAPGGLFKAIKFVAGDPSGLREERAPATDELEAIQHVKSVRHPFLLSMDRVEILDGELVIVMELADRNLADLLKAEQAAGRRGVERDKLLDYLGEAANVLDHMNARHGLQHLDVKPANLFLVADHVKVADFGLVHSVGNHANGETVSLGALSPLYAAPELYRNTLSQSCDQYSLAIVYVELLTGTLPFDGKNARQLMLQHSTQAPDLAALPPEDRPIIARALSKDLNQRFNSCTALINALLTGVAEPVLPVAPRDSRVSLNEPEALATGAAGSVANASGSLGRTSGCAARPSAPTPTNTPILSRAKVETRDDLPVASTFPLRPVQGKYLPEYQFVTCLGRTPSAENWEAQTADGRRWLVRFLFGVVGHNARREHEALTRLRELSHDVLPRLQLAHGGPGCLIAAAELPENTLRDRFQEARAGGAEGLPRQQLLDWLWTVAEALDELAHEHGLTHLGLQPRSLHFQGKRVWLADFGLLPLLCQPAGQMEGQLQPRYAAPEVLQRKGSPASDQYSLAVIYQEMLTGTPPFRGRRTGTPDLTPLSDGDQDVVARALEADPARRFASCVELVRALDGMRPAARGDNPVRVAAQVGTPACAQVREARTVLAELMAEAAARRPVAEPSETWLTLPTGEPVLRSRFAASLPADNPAAAFEGFRERWRARLERTGKDLLVYRVALPTPFWKRWFGRPPGLEVELQWTAARPPAVPLPVLTVHIRGDQAAPGQANLLRQIGPVLVEGLRSQLHGHPERRSNERLLWGGTVQAEFCLPDGTRTGHIDGLGKDVSATGMGIYLPEAAVPGSTVTLFLDTRGRRDVTLVGKCVRVQRCGNDWYVAGIVFE